MNSLSLAIGVGISLPGVWSGGAGPIPHPGSDLLLADGSSFFLLADGSSSLQLAQ